LDNYLADASNLLFANLDDYFQDDVPTKSEVENYVPLSSLIDLKDCSSIEGDGYTLVEYPFFSNADKVFFSCSSKVLESGSVVSRDSLMILKKSFVTEDTKAHSIQFVASVLADHSYYDEYGFDSVSFINKPNFTGIVLLSYLDGTFDSIYQYKDGLVLSSRILRYFETPDDSTTIYLTQVQCEDIATKVLGGTLSAAVVIAERPMAIARSDGPAFGTNHDDEETRRPVSGGGVTPSQTNYTITLDIGSERNSLRGVGRVYGSGTYTRGSTASISVTPATSFHFIRWEGDFSRRGPCFAISVTQNYTSIAIIGSTGESIAVSPCIDTTKNVANMLKFMSIAPTDKGSYLGGTYGLVRTKEVKDSNGNITYEPKKHSGYDFAADVGTPIYAQYDGTISFVKTGCPSGNNGEDGKEYNGKYGNAIKLKTNIGNDELEFMYAHLDYDTPIAINMRTGKQFAEGDPVKRGELIGYSGRSGNAYNVTNKHVHWEVTKNGKRIDGKDYINGIVSTSTGEINGIECD